MKYLRKWTLPSGLVVHRYEPVEHPAGWGQSLFWYCHSCSMPYAWAELFGEEDEEIVYHPSWHGVSGLCPGCEPTRYSIRGTLESGHTIGWNIPLEVAHYQLGCEIAFLDHPDHPHNKESMRS